VLEEISRVAFGNFTLSLAMQKIHPRDWWEYFKIRSPERDAWVSAVEAVIKYDAEEINKPECL